MKSDSKYKIEFAGLKIGSHQFNFNADKKFFDRFSFSDFNDVAVNIVASNPNSNSSGCILRSGK